MAKSVPALDGGPVMTHSPAPAVRQHPKAVQATGEPPPPENNFVPSAEDVARRAYLYFQNHGIANGRHLQDWLQAEAELTAEGRRAGR